MNNANCLLFLGALSIINLFILIFISLLDFTKASSKQKIYLIRMGLVLIISTTFIFYIEQFFSFPTIKIILPYKPINQFTINSDLLIFSKSNIAWSYYLFIGYLSGLFMMLARIVFSYLKSSRLLAHSHECQIQGYEVLLNKNILSPLSFGFPKARIYLPMDSETKWTKRKIAMCLAHEQNHLDQNDSAWKILSLIVEAFLFFAPWVYFLHRKFELEIEIFCDEQTCTRTKVSTQEYGNLLLEMLSIRSNNFIFTNIKTSTLKRRIIAMKSQSIHRPLLVSALSMALVLMGGTALATSSEILGNKNIFKITSKIFMDGNLVSSPQIIAHANQKARITLSKNEDNDDNQGLKLTLIVNEIAKNNIRINYDFEYHNGNKTIHSSPEMRLKTNQESEIHIASASGHSYDMKVIAERQ